MGDTVATAREITERALDDTGHMTRPEQARIITGRLRDAGLLMAAPRTPGEVRAMIRALLELL